MSDERVLNHFVKSALTSRKIEMKDTGIARRTYCYVTDAIRLMFAALLVGNESVYNIGGISRTSIQELAVLIGEMTGADVVVPEVGMGLVGAPQDVRLDIEKVLRLVDNKSFIDMREGLLRTISWYQQLI
jgi:nucleoside-diphosphate-sugar epimerase